jgi:hypothetical protein
MLVAVIVLSSLCLALLGLIGYLVHRISTEPVRLMAMATKAMELLKAANLEEQARVDVLRDREVLYRKQLEDALVEERVVKTQPKQEEYLELEDGGRIHMSQLEPITASDLEALV